MRVLPDVENKTEDTVAKELADLGFVVDAEYQNSGEVAKQIVMGYKDYQSGDKLEAGSKVTIIVSKGMEVTTSPIQ